MAAEAGEFNPPGVFVSTDWSGKCSMNVIASKFGGKCVTLHQFMLVACIARKRWEEGVGGGRRRSVRRIGGQSGGGGMFPERRW